MHTYKVCCRLERNKDIGIMAFFFMTPHPYIPLHFHLFHSFFILKGKASSKMFCDVPRASRARTLFHPFFSHHCICNFLRISNTAVILYYTHTYIRFNYSSSNEISGLLKKNEYVTIAVKSRVRGFSCAKLEAGGNGLGVCTARYESKSCCCVFLMPS